ncbi:MAG: nitroreductase family protein [archaeon]|nr:nitroreductase family protein [archaeon]
MEKLILFCLFVSLSTSIKMEEKLKEDIIKLPDPVTKGGMPVYQAMNRRQCKRGFHDDERYDLTLLQLSELLWMGYGPNRDNGYKTAASAFAAFPFDVYVFLRTGIYKYNPTENQLELFLNRDFRAVTGQDKYVANANVNLVFMGVYDREKDVSSKEEKQRLMELDVGHLAYNILIFCANLGLQCVPRANIVQNAILQALNLSPDTYYIPLCLSAGW